MRLGSDLTVASSPPDRRPCYHGGYFSPIIPAPVRVGEEFPPSWDLKIRSKQVEDEATQLAREREVRGSDDFSIKNCIAVLNTLEVTKEEKVKAYKVFKDSDNRQIS